MKTVLEYLENSEKKYSDKIAVIDENGKYTYKELIELSKRIGTAISKIIEPRNPVPKPRFTKNTIRTYNKCFRCKTYSYRQRTWRNSIWASRQRKCFLYR